MKIIASIKSITKYGCKNKILNLEMAILASYIIVWFFLLLLWLFIFQYCCLFFQPVFKRGCVVRYICQVLHSITEQYWSKIHLCQIYQEVDHTQDPSIMNNAHVSNIYSCDTNQTNIKRLIKHSCCLLHDFTVQCAVNVSFCGYSILVKSLTPVFNCKGLLIHIKQKWER